MAQRRFALLKVPYERKAAVIDEINFGSEPRGGYITFEKFTAEKMPRWVIKGTQRELQQPC